MGESVRFKNVLIVDDDPTILALLSKVLKEKGYEVTTANDAPAGLQIAMEQFPDLIILDVMMPIINGFNICKLLKEEDKHKHIPIILLTSRDQIADVRIGMEMGAEAYLTKPLNTAELFKTIDLIAKNV